MVKRLRGKRLGYVGITQHHGDLKRVKQVGKSARQHCGRARHHFRRFEDRPIARRQHARQRAEQGEQRRIPGAQNANRAFGLMHHPGLGAQLVIRGKHLTRLVFDPA